MLAVARALVSMPRPKRSVIFLAATGEEKGILGSDHFVHHPPVPLGAIVANVNLDNFVMLAPVRDLVAYGARYSTLDGEVTAMLGRLGLAASEDPLPGMTIFTRSDHYAFMRRGVPGVMFFAGVKSGKEGKDGAAVMREYFDRVHHTPRDRFEQGIDWGAGVTWAEANLAIGYAIANRVGRPRWKGRHFFHQAGVPIS
jgi:Zn-dependent M28 family amino/carboxypeptidase